MRVTRLEPRGFRNLADTEIGLGEGVTVLHGPNGAGKTNLLEAIHFALVGGSFRSGNDRDLIAFEADAARVELELTGGDGTVTALASIDRRGERRHSLDAPAVRAGAAPSVFLPDRLQLVKGPPAHRRSHLDRFVAALWPSRADLRARFGRTLAQRNALVARVRAGEASQAALPTWDERLASEASELVASRADATATLSAPFSRWGQELGLQGAELAYRPRVEGGAEEIARGLAERRARGLDRAYTTYGPQLDEVKLGISVGALRRFGSQGEQRTALLALLFAERQALVDAGRPAPLMLLDDVMSELDPDRRRRLVSALAEAGQALITATEAAQVPAADSHLRIAVTEGRTARLAEAA